MAFNKSKALENALKLLNQGKTAQAIAEYQQILRNDPKDQATLMTVGDLFARQGDMKQAVEYFERLAQVYLTDGFNSKAIAIYKKIAKLAPNELAPLERLADLYVQQGVLSEARPLFLQIAEAHLKANRAPKAVEVLHRLLDVEPENPRVQMRLAELYNVMGQKKEAAQTYYNYAQRLHDRGEPEEAQKLIERALEVDGSNPAALFLKARILASAGKTERAISILENHPQADAGGEVTDLLVDLDLKIGENEKAADHARNQLVRGSSHFGILLRVADYLIDNGHPQDAFPLLDELREPMIEVNEHDKFLGELAKLAEKLPKNIQVLEMTADFCRHTSDPFRLSAALSELVDIYDDKGDKARAEELMLELIDRNKGDERLIARLQKLRGQTGVAPELGLGQPLEAPAEASVKVSAPEHGDEKEAAAAPVALAPEEPLDEETQKYIAQALTDVDLFSSYGLTQKATHLLENVLQRAPRHTPTLERLFDLQVGLGNDKRTAELAAVLENIHRQRGDSVGAERFAGLRQRFRTKAGVSEEELAAAAAELMSVQPAPPSSAPAPSPTTVPAPGDAHARPAAAASAAPPPAPVEAAVPPMPLEFEVPLISVEPDAEPLEAVREAPSAAGHVAPSQPAQEEEVDLSDEWASIMHEATEGKVESAPAEFAVEQTAGEERQEAEPAAAPTQGANEVAGEEESEFVLNADELEMEIVELEAAAPPAAEVMPDALDPMFAPAPEEMEAAPEIEAIPEEAAREIPSPEIMEEPAAASHSSVEPETEDAPEIELIEEPQSAGISAADFELELKPEPSFRSTVAGPATTEDFLSELASEVEELEAPSPTEPSHAPLQEAVPAVRAAVPEPDNGSLDQLAEVFQEFRSELGEFDEQTEDLETHYNLGIAYREMGLLDEAIGEFQKVAKAIQNGKPFRYAMNCSTLLALSFMDKGEPKIAALWYRRALETPGLDPETILALRYDLGVSLETAGESPAALDSFRQVYAMNIDYRDVADRIATLQKV